MKTSEINIRDPFVLAYKGTYYLYGTRAKYTWQAPEDLKKLGFDVYISKDLENWQQKEVFSWYPDFWSDEKFWAPEVHVYQGKFYMFATFGSKTTGVCKGTQILVANCPKDRLMYIVQSLLHHLLGNVWMVLFMWKMVSPIWFFVMNGNKLGLGRFVQLNYLMICPKLFLSQSLY